MKIRIHYNENEKKLQTLLEEIIVLEYENFN